MSAPHCAYRFCPQCAADLQHITQEEDGGPKSRLRCPACHWTHWNNPTPVLAAVIELADRHGEILLARNAAWPGKFFGLITGFMEAGETPEGGITREVAEETVADGRFAQPDRRLRFPADESDHHRVPHRGPR